MNRSETIDKIAAALVVAQGNIEGAAKDNKGNYGKYATLASVVAACKGPLLENGISFVQTFEPSEPGNMCLTTTLLHTSGQYISGTCSMPLPKQDPQGYGSAATYARRQGLAAIVGVCPEDDDGEAATPKGNTRQAKPEAAAEPDPLEDLGTFKSALHRAFTGRKFTPDAELAAVKAALASYKIASIEQTSLTQRRDLVAHVRGGKADKYRETEQPKEAAVAAGR